MNGRCKQLLLLLHSKEMFPRGPRSTSMCDSPPSPPSAVTTVPTPWKEMVLPLSLRRDGMGKAAATVAWWSVCRHRHRRRKTRNRSGKGGVDTTWIAKNRI